MMKNGCGCGAE